MADLAWRVPFGRSVLALSALFSGTCLLAAVQDEGAPVGMGLASQRAAMIEPMLDTYCSRCHNNDDKVAGLSVADLKADDIQTGRNAEAGEKILRRVAAGEMLPHSKKQPDAAMRADFVAWLDDSRAHYVAAHPDPDRATVRRLNRTEYANAVRDLLGIEADVSGALPPDNSGFGFDNIADVLRANRPVTEFLRASYTFLNARLAQHYGISRVRGPAFRKVMLEPGTPRGGLLGQASILTVTSYGNRTSVVKRGKWVMENLLASPPPPPPADVPALQAEHDGRKLTAREQIELHRADPASSSGPVRMDPLGFALENFDAVGNWRKMDAGQLIDAGAVLPDGTQLAGFTGLQQILLDRRDEFARAFTERLMTYALARGLAPQDMPAVRAIARSAAADGYRVQSIIRGIVTSPGFTMRRIPGQATTAQAATGAGGAGR